jgi:serine O-acetyltransferase
LLGSRGVQAVEIYRLSHWAYQHKIPVLPEIFRRLNQFLFSVDIYAEAEIESGFALIHPSDVVIGQGAVIGEDVRIFNGVSLGNRLTESRGRPDGFPVIGDGVTLCTGSKIIGPVSVGARSMVGANAVVTFDVPPDSRVVGARAVILPPVASAQAELPPGELPTLP